jgi:hypothetical protein
MKKVVLSIFSVALLFNVNAQVADSISMGPGYANQVYYSFDGGTIKSNPVNNWDIAFTVYNLSVSIRINEGQGAQLYIAPFDTSEWNTFTDTTGLSNWVRLFNGTQSWDDGAFNKNSNFPSYGWGTYNQITKDVNGNRLFALKTVSGEWKKIWIEKLQFDTLYTFRYANLDNTNEVRKSFNKKDYRSEVDLIFYSISNNEFVNNEPNKNDWQFVFTSYIDVVSGIPYIVRGMLNNRNIQSIRVLDVVDPLTLNYNDYQLNNNISEIGYDWKSFNNQTFQWLLENWSFFVETQDGDIWQIWFTGFGGTATGKANFNKRQVAFASVNNVDGAQMAKVALYPNPVIDIANIVISSSVNTMADIRILDMNGRIVKNERINLNNGLQNITMDVNNLNSGIYFINISMNGVTENIKMIKQ